MTSSLSSEELRLLRDPAARPQIQPGARADALLRGHVLGQIAEVMRGEGIAGLLVKGAALAITVYPDPAARRMSDIDLLVAERHQERAIRGLERLGWRVAQLDDRRWSQAMLGETMVQARVGAMDFTVEVHSSLDKVVHRPIAFADLAERALPAPGLLGLSVPTLEDHFLLVTLHASTNEFRHVVALQDLELILRAGIDLRVLEERTDRFQLRTAMYVMLSVLRHLGAASVDEALVRRFDVGRLRKAVLSRFYRVDRFPPVDGDFVLGVEWLARQLPLWDDPARYARGVVQYGGLRAMERLLQALDR